MPGPLAAQAWYHRTSESRLPTVPITQGVPDWQEVQEVASTARVLPSRRHGSRTRFFREFLAHPRLVGAVAPSSRFLARCMVEGVDFAGADAVVEYGCGTGALTAHIVPRLPSGCRFFAIEVNPRLAQVWQQRFPHLRLYRDSAVNVLRLCRREGVEAVDIVFSALPWAAFDARTQVAILSATAAVLRPGGEFVAFGYSLGTWLPGARRFRRLLPRYFSRVLPRRAVWRNLPPAFVIRCRR